MITTMMVMNVQGTVLAGYNNPWEETSLKSSYKATITPQGLLFRAFRELMSGLYKYLPA